MKKKYILIVALMFSSLSFAEPQIWEAQKEGLTFTLLGSVHAGKDRFYPLPSLFNKRLKEADALFVEANIKLKTPLHFPKGLPTSKHINTEEKIQLKNIAKELKLPFETLLSLPPWQTSMLMQMEQIKRMDLDPEQGIDLYALSQSKKWKIPVIGLETLQEQIDLLSNAGEDGIALLHDTLKHWEESKTRLPCIIKAWEYGDAKALTYIVENETGKNAFEKKLLEDRNHQWVKKLTDKKQIKAKNYVLVVGALHLYGKEGLINLLREKGFKVKLMTKGREVACFTKA